MNITKRLPITVAGLILALLSLGNLLHDINPRIKYFLGMISAILIILLVVKAITYPKDIKDDFKNPVTASSSGTFSMSLMLLSTYTLGFMPTISQGIWIIGIGLHILLMIYFTYHFIMRDFDILAVNPTYWIVYVGISMGAVTAPFHGLNKIGTACIIIGFASMLITLPLITYRHIKYPDISDANKPTTCIYTALFSILIVGYLNSAPKICPEFLMALYCIACIFYIFAFYKLVEYRTLEFYPSFSAFTFPFVISALATKGVIKIAGENLILSSILTIETLISVITAFYVITEYVNFLKK